MDWCQRFNRFKLVLAQLNNPHLRVPPTIHVTGTNGKGSTIAFMRSILEKSGFKVHTFTSPHLINVTERFTVASLPLSQSKFDDVKADIQPYAKLHQLSFFEQLTMMAFKIFSEIPADYCLMEVGIGGEFDPTNVIQNPFATIITTIDYDHMDQLGPTLTDIAQAKAGIIKQKCPVITAVTQSTILDVIHMTATTQQAPLYALGVAFDFKTMQHSWQFHMDDDYIDLPYPLHLRGDHQLQNAAVAIAALRAVAPSILNNNVIQKGIMHATWRGRLEQFIYKGRVIWYDMAHNPQGASVLNSYFKQRMQLLCVVVAQQDNRNIDAFIHEIQDISYQVFYTLLDDYQIFSDNINSIISNTSYNNYEILVTGSKFLYNLLDQLVNSLDHD